MPNVDDLPLNVEIIPQVWTADVSVRLSRSIDDCSSMRAAVAFWTINRQLLSEHLAQRLDDSGFLCVDINTPTDLDRLNQLSIDGANVYLSLRSPNNQMEDTEAGNRAMPKHLMHAKFLLFDFSDGTAEIWSGSHNWTRRSLLGPNLELSVILKVGQSSTLYAVAVENLEMIRGLCTPFDTDDLAYYKYLQSTERTEMSPVIELEGKEVGSLEHTRIELFGTEPGELSQLGSIGRKVIVEVTESDLKSEHTHVYIGEILQSGLLKSANPFADGIDFSERRHAFRRGPRYPELVKESRLDHILTEARYFVTIQLLANITGKARTVFLAPDSRWKQDPNDPLLERMRLKDRRTKDPIKVTVRVPAKGTSMKELPNGTKRERQLSIEARRASSEMKLVSKRLLIDQDGNPITVDEAKEL